MEHCIQKDEEDILNFLHPIKRAVERSWSDDMNGIEAVQQMPSETLKHDKDGKDTLTIRQKDLQWGT